MAGLSATAGSGFDYIQAAEPADPENAELWFDTDGGTDGNGEVKVYDGSQWDTTGYVSHDQLTNVSPGDHFSPGNGLSFSGGTLALLLSEYLTIDANGDLSIASGSIGEDRLAFDTATQSELNNHAGDTGNPHSVDHSQLSGVGESDHHDAPTVVQSGIFDLNGSSNTRFPAWTSSSELVFTDANENEMLVTDSISQKVVCQYYRNSDNNMDYELIQI
ncbi:hypothetical protein ACOZ4F_15025 [Haloarcula marismortui]|uniref:hypothetical protein n=1 Tax=Haloarcula marismortui TaxID=2238 RepID=UPI003C71F199